jgi:hypothetical protein
MATRLLPAVFLCCLLSPAARAQQSIYFEAESCQFAGDWTVVGNQDDSFGKAHLRTLGSANLSDATTVVSIPAEGTYHVWRARGISTRTLASAAFRLESTERCSRPKPAPTG